MLWIVGHFVFDGVGRGEGSPSTDLGAVEPARADDGTVDADAVDVFHDRKVCCVGFGLLRAAGFDLIEEGWPLRVCGDKEATILAGDGARRGDVTGVRRGKCRHFDGNLGRAQWCEVFLVGAEGVIVCDEDDGDRGSVDCKRDLQRSAEEVHGGRGRSVAYLPVPTAVRLALQVQARRQRPQQSASFPTIGGRDHYDNTMGIGCVLIFACHF